MNHTQPLRQPFSWPPRRLDLPHLHRLHGDRIEPHQGPSSASANVNSTLQNMQVRALLRHGRKAPEVASATGTIFSERVPRLRLSETTATAPVGLRTLISGTGDACSIFCTRDGPIAVRHWPSPAFRSPPAAPATRLLAGHDESGPAPKQRQPLAQDGVCKRRAANGGTSPSRRDVTYHLRTQPTHQSYAGTPPAVGFVGLPRQN